MKIVNINLKSGIGITKGYYQYLTEGWKSYLPHSQMYLDKARYFLLREKPDIVFLTEIDGGSARSNHIDQADVLSKQTGSHGIFFPATKFLRIWNQGNAIISSHEIRAARSHHLPGKGERRVLGEAQLKIGDLDLTAFVTHLSLNKKVRKDQIEAIVHIIERKNGPMILAGDFNTDVPEETRPFNKLDLKRFSAKTFPSWNPSKNLDQIYLSPQLKVTKQRTYANDLFSDHLPLILEAELAQ